MPSRIILASASPRRAALLRQIGLDFEVLPVPDESHPEHVPLSTLLPPQAAPVETAVRLARDLAEAKAAAVAATAPDALVIGVDTIVVAGEQILEKPADDADAMRMLRLLSGRRHDVVTAVALVREHPALRLVESSQTAVWFRSLSARELAAYVASGEPLDKAGAYGIQGRAAALVERIEGDYFTVVGLPLARLATMLRRAGIETP